MALNYSGNIPPIKRILLPETGIFKNRIHQFEKLYVISPPDQAVTLNFWRSLSTIQHDLHTNLTIPSVLEPQQPYLTQTITEPYFATIIDELLEALSAHTFTEILSHTINEMKLLPTHQKLSYAQALLQGHDDQVPGPYRLLTRSALQVLFYQQAQAAQLPENETPYLSDCCPMCHTPPIASVIDPEYQGLRYLYCGLCETRWHHVRSMCYSCNGTEKVEQIALEDDLSPMKAECCPSCKVYIKHLDRTRNPLMDVFVEDLATLPLDIALNHEHYIRKSINTYLS